MILINISILLLIVPVISTLRCCITSATFCLSSCLECCEICCGDHVCSQFC